MTIFLWIIPILTVLCGAFLLNNNIIKIPQKQNIITEEDDESTDFTCLLKKMYDNDLLHLTDIYGNYSTEDWRGATFQMPYSDGENRNIRITVSAYDNIAEIYDTPDTHPFHGGTHGGFTGRTNGVKEYVEILDFYINTLKGTKFDTSNYSKYKLTGKL